VYVTAKPVVGVGLQPVGRLVNRSIVGIVAGVR
jgi:hypothetical protein